MTLTNGTTYLDSVAEYSCGPDYWLDGSSVRTCLMDGRWTGEKAYCVRECNALNVLYLFLYYISIKYMQWLSLSSLSYPPM